MLRVAILISGGGTTLQNLIDHRARGELNDVELSLVIASREGITGLQRATRAGIASTVVPRTQFQSVEHFSNAVFAQLQHAGVELVCLAGWLCLLRLPPHWRGRVMNIHPALLPSFGGQGMFGQRVHQAVLDHGCKVSGCTVHFVDDSYDTGPIIAQRTCAVHDDDTAHTLAERVFEQECIAYPQAIRDYSEGRLVVQGRRVRRVG